jgi:hypothetical protein
MKSLLVFFVFILGVFQVKAGNAGGGDNARSSGSLLINFSNHSETAHADSVLVIFDKYDHTGAGIVRKIFYPNENHVIEIADLPAGKYYVSIQCLGLHHDYSEKVINIERNKANKLKIKLQDCEVFQVGKAEIPTDHTDFTKLSVTSIR